MRIVSGKYRHRIIEWPDDAKNIRPTKDRIREAIFSALNNINDFNVLDLYAGSGAMGIEALSRGAKKAYFVDMNNVAISTVNKNIKSLNIENSDYEIIKTDDMSALKSFIINNIKFDLIILDPPYAQGEYTKIVDFILENSLLSENGILVLESNYHIELNNMDYKKDKEYSYGEIKVRILWR